MKLLGPFLFLSLTLWGQTPLKRVAVISDFNSSYGSTQYGSEVKKAVTKLNELRPDVVLATGDMVAGQKAGLDYRGMWNAFHEVVTIPLKNYGLPFAVTVGNHDGSGYPKFKNERDIYTQEWLKHKPNLEFSDDSYYPIYYSFSFDDILFLSIDSTMVGPLSLMQLNFLDKELKKHHEKKYKIVFTHVPMFQFNQSNPNESFFDQQLFELLKSHKVQLYLSGHHHAYYPGYYDGIHFISQSCLGAGAEKLIGSTTTSPRAITMIEFHENSFEIYALSAPDYNRKINHTALPQKIEAKGKVMVLKDKSGE
jgi:predicted MPP superfamily phosphohydrolase